MSKAVHRTLEAKLAALTGPEWDSSDEETPVVPLESSKSKNPLPPTTSTAAKKGPRRKKTKPKKAKQSRVIYIGHLPQNFQEPELMGFLSQFGVVTRLKLSRSRKTCNSKCFCFCEFANSQVAAIVADTMSGYFLKDKRLVCHVVPLEKIRKDLFEGWDRKFVKVDWQAKHRERVNKEKSADVMSAITQRLLEREKKKKQAFKAMGIDYDFPGYEASAEIAKEEMDVGQDENTLDRANKEERKGRTESSNVEAVQGSKVSKKKRSMSESSDGSSSKNKRARKDSIDSQGSLSEKSKKKKRKDSMDSHGRSSGKKHSKRKDSMDSSGSSSGKKKQSKRKESIDSTASSSSSSKKKLHSKRKHSDASLSSVETPETKSNETTLKSTPPVDKTRDNESASGRRGAKTEVKKKKAAKQHRRAST